MPNYDKADQTYVARPPVEDVGKCLLFGKRQQHVNVKVW